MRTGYELFNVDTINVCNYCILTLTDPYGLAIKSHSFTYLEFDQMIETLINFMILSNGPIDHNTIFHHINNLLIFHNNYSNNTTIRSDMMFESHILAGLYSKLLNVHINPKTVLKSFNMESDFLSSPGNIPLSNLYSDYKINRYISDDKIILVYEMLINGVIKFLWYNDNNILQKFNGLVNINTNKYAYINQIILKDRINIASLNISNDIIVIQNCQIDSSEKFEYNYSDRIIESDIRTEEISLKQFINN